MRYSADLAYTDDGGEKIVESTVFEAVNDIEAKSKSKEWAMTVLGSLGGISERTRLQVVENGRGVFTDVLGGL